MSQQDLWTVIGRAKLDLNFSGQLNSDFEGAIKSAGYHLDPNEIEQARHQITARRGLMIPPGMPPGMPPPTQADIEFQKKMMRDTMMRVSNLWSYVTDSLKGALSGAARTYRTVTWMNTIMFGCGLGLFVFSAIYGAITHQVLYAAVFGGLGAGTFVSLFLLGSLDRTQSALSNLMQVEIAFTNYLEQMTFWEGYSQVPDGIPQEGVMPMRSLANIEKASNSLHELTVETIKLLEEFVERSRK